MNNREENLREEVYTKALKAGKRTYFFDVKQTKNKEKYLVITESKKVFNQTDGSFDYDKHKIFLYKEDYEKFLNTLDNVIEYIKTGIALKEEVDAKRNGADSFTDDLKY
ncbi:MAG: DUF3276 family protein [Bacteroidales bacterium]|nr:DUF3276 family protein [Bacteroidales bacterium]